MQQSNVPVPPKKAWTISKQSGTVSVRENKRKKQQDVREVTIHLCCNTYLMIMVAFYGLAFLQLHADC